MKQFFLLGLFIPLFAIAQQSPTPLSLADVASGSTNFSLSSPNFQDGQALPTAIACVAQGGSNGIPLITWQNPPPGTQTYALTLTDPDAPKGTWVHWFVYNIPPTATNLNADVLKLATQGKNSWGNPTYQGPCPPSGKSHHYVFTLYALSQLLPTSPLIDYAHFQFVVQNNPGFVLSQTSLNGIFP